MLRKGPWWVLFGYYLVLWPFRGHMAWETQIGPWVIQWATRVDGLGMPNSWRNKGIFGTPLRIWRDDAW